MVKNENIASEHTYKFSKQKKDLTKRLKIPNMNAVAQEMIKIK